MTSRAGRPSSTNVASVEFQASRPSRDSIIDGYCEVFGNRVHITARELANAATNETWETPRVTDPAETAETPNTPNDGLGKDTEMKFLTTTTTQQEIQVNTRFQYCLPRFKAD